MALIVLLVSLKPSVPYAIAAFIGASLGVVILARVFVQPPLFFLRRASFGKLWSFAWPLFLFTIGLTTFRNIDLVLVKAFDPTGESTGFYAAAKNLTLVLGLFTASFSPLLQSKLAELAAAGRRDAAQALLGNSLRLTICMLPLAGLASGSALEVVRLIYGAQFSQAGPLLAVLIFGAVCISLVSVTVAAVIAAKRPSLPLLLTGPIFLCAPILYAMAIGRFGPLGAAWLATGLAFLAAVPSQAAALRLWGLGWPMATILKSGLITVLAYGLAMSWTTSGYLVLFKLALGSGAVFLLFFSFGELKRYEMGRFFSALFPGHRAP
jgi:O-antigen/teichoic acid export membrane protein